MAFTPEALQNVRRLMAGEPIPQKRYERPALVGWVAPPPKPLYTRRYVRSGRLDRVGNLTQTRINNR